jgi:YbaB/EbfC DNA-binding family protein
MDPEQWLADYDKRLTDIAARAREASACLREVSSTKASPRGEVEVRIDAGGTLEDLTLTPAARTLESDELARLILDTTRQAQHAVSAQIADISARYFGDGPALEVIKKYLPAGTPVSTDPDDDYFANPPEITQ